MTLKSKSASRIVLFFGYFFFILTPIEALYAPFLSIPIISMFNLVGIEKDCDDNFIRLECRYPSLDPNSAKKLALSPCPPCMEDIRCQDCMAGNFAVYAMTTVFFLSILSVLLSPFKTRTMKGYYARVVLIIFSGMFSFGGYLLFVVPVIVWGPVIMITRRRWYPLPTDKVKENEPV